MTLETAFTAANLFALLGWAALIFAPVARARLVAAARIVGFVLCLAYATALTLALTHPTPGAAAGGGFGSLAAVAILFSNKGALLAGWIHYLAFDLWTGAWEARDAERAGVPHWLVLPCLFLTFMAGPVGLGLYLIIRTGFRSRAMAEAA
jgi:hypothetical protein